MTLNVHNQQTLAEKVPKELFHDAISNFSIYLLTLWRQTMYMEVVSHS
jgi:hypothetical protein